MKRFGNLFEKVVTFDNLLLAANKTLRGQKRKPAAARFYYDLEPELLRLQEELESGSWRPRPYRVFTICEPKPRQICASDLRDRVVHHAICNTLDPIFERRMIYDSYACRVGKGTHAAVERARRFARKANYYLQCDVRKYFASIEHEALKTLLRRILRDKRLLELLDRIIEHSPPGAAPGRGLPIGNLTSQYFANLYLGESQQRRARQSQRQSRFPPRERLAQPVGCGLRIASARKRPGPSPSSRAGQAPAK
jgi:retron-type reverse transcriptase